jgi:DNA-binding PadR family transcriptional regulator
MTSKITKNDRDLLTSIAEHKVLTVSQLSALSQRSSQVVRRRIRALEMEGLIITRMHGYGRDRGRPEDLILLTEKGVALLVDEGMLSGHTVCNADKAEDPHSIDHLLLVNWFRIHLLQIERNIPQLSVKYLDPNSHPLAWDSGDSPSTPERIPANKQEKAVEFIPDGIFSITYKEAEKKTLLFFLEADMGTETIASTNRNHKDIRQKILRYQALFRSGNYKRYERVFDSKLSGFRLLFLVNSTTRLISLCRFVREMPPSDFIWLVDQGKMFSHGLSAKIWARGGRDDNPPESILGPGLACELPLMDIGNNPLAKE